MLTPSEQDTLVNVTLDELVERLRAYQQEVDGSKTLVAIIDGELVFFASQDSVQVPWEHGQIESCPDCKRSMIHTRECRRTRLGAERAPEARKC